MPAVAAPASLLDQFVQQLRTFDWYYQYSDDHKGWVRGEVQYDALIATAKQLPRDAVLGVVSEVARRSLMSTPEAAVWVSRFMEAVDR